MKGGYVAKMRSYSKKCYCRRNSGIGTVMVDGRIGRILDDRKRTSRSIRLKRAGIDVLNAADLHDWRYDTDPYGG